MKIIVPLALVLSCAPVWAQNALTVRVVDAAGAPVPGAPVPGARVQVRAYLDEMLLLAPKTTGADGTATFAMPKNPAGKITAGQVLVGAPGFAFADATAMSDKLEVQLGRGATWRGKVVDETGKPLSGATISLQGVSAPVERFTEGIYFFGEAIPKLYSATSGADGRFRIEGAPVGKDLRFRVTRPGYVVVNGQDGRAGNEAQISLVRGGSLHGRVLDVSGKPLAKIEVLRTRWGWEAAAISPRRMKAALSPSTISRREFIE